MWFTDFAQAPACPSEFREFVSERISIPVMLPATPLTTTPSRNMCTHTLKGVPVLRLLICSTLQHFRNTLLRLLVCNKM